MNNNKKRNHANNSNMAAREQAPNANQLNKVVSEFFNQGSSHDIIYFFTKMYTAALDSNEAEAWSNVDRINMANVFCAFTNFVVKSEKLVK